MAEFISFFLCVLSVFLYIPTYASTIQIYPNPNHHVISEAVAKAKPGDTVLLSPGEYIEPRLIINKSVTIKSQKDNEAIYINNSGGNSIEITANGAKIIGLKIIGSGKSSYQDLAAIRVNNSDYVEIIKNEVVESQYGILFNNSHSGLIINNSVNTNSTPLDLLGDGIHLWKSENNVVSSNNVSGHRDGIYLEFSKNGFIEKNKISKNIRYGLHFMFSSGNTFENNVFSNNDAGVAVMYSKNIKMLRNEYSKNKGTASYGLLLKDITDSEVEGNKFLDNTVAIFMEGSNRNFFKKNIFDKNLWALRILSSCDSNEFKQNDFLLNQNEVASNGLQSDNSFSGNFWLKQDNIDLDHDGFVDIAYQPTSFSSYILERYNVSILIVNSPFMAFLDWLEKIVPSISPISLRDNRPIAKGIDDDKY